jgi:hypothetical protein
MFDAKAMIIAMTIRLMPFGDNVVLNAEALMDGTIIPASDVYRAKI